MKQHERLSHVCPFSLPWCSKSTGWFPLASCFSSALGDAQNQQVGKLITLACLCLWEKAEWRSEAIGVFSLWELCSSHSNLLEGEQLVTWKGPYQLKARFHSKAETTRETSVCLTIRSRLCNTLSQREGWIAKDFIWMHTPAPLGLAFS